MSQDVAKTAYLHKMFIVLSPPKTNKRNQPIKSNNIDDKPHKIQLF